MAIVINEDNVQLLAADKNFVDLVNNRITMYGQIPYTVPQRLIVDVIKESARLFYRLYWKATEKCLYYINPLDIVDFTSGNQNVGYESTVGYQVKLPGWVSLIKDIYESNQNIQPTSQELIDNVQLLQRSAPYGQTILGINNSLYILEAGCRMIEENAYKSVFGTTVPFHFQPFSKILALNKKIQNSYILDMERNVDIQYLYQDDLFIKHVIARVKTELKRLIAGHTFPMAGGGTINAEEICNNLDDVSTVEEVLKASSGIGDIILIR